MTDDGIEIVCHADNHVVRLYANYSDTTADWTVVSFVDGRTEVHDATATTDLWTAVAAMLPRALKDADEEAA